MTRRELHTRRLGQGKIDFFFRFRDTKYFILSLGTCYRNMSNMFKNDSVRIIEIKQFLPVGVKQRHFHAHLSQVQHVHTLPRFWE
jgi:hypothetical protein